MKRILTGVCVSMVLASCTWVTVTAKGEGVRFVQSLKTVESCKQLGQVNVKVVDQVIFHRDADKVAGELIDLARNEAAMMNGDTIVPVSEIVDGRRRFAVFQCMPAKRMD